MYPKTLFSAVLIMPRSRKSSTSDSADLAARSTRYPQGVAPMAVKLSQPDRMELRVWLNSAEQLTAPLSLTIPGLIAMLQDATST